MSFSTSAAAKLGIRCAFQCKNARGEVIKTIEVSGAIPLSKLGLTEAQAQALVNQSKDSHGPHDRQ